LPTHGTVIAGILDSEKAKPVVKQGRKAMGLNDSRVAIKVIWLFIFYGRG